MGVPFSGRALVIGGSGAIAVLIALGACTGDDPAPSTADPDAGSGPDTSAVDGRVDDAAPLDGGADANVVDASTFCTTKTKSAGTTDFFCADFDDGPLNKGFTKTIGPDGGVLELTAAAAFSPPNALFASSETNPDASTPRRGGALEWTSVGGTKVTSVIATVKINPVAPAGGTSPGTGDVEILAIDYEGGSASLRFTDGAGAGGVPGYSGYFLRATANSGGTASSAVATVQPVSGLWTTVTMSVLFPTAVASGNVSVRFDTLQAIPITNGPTQATTVVTTRIGNQAQGAMLRISDHRFDDLIVEVARE